jgi:hypothetical protein
VQAPGDHAERVGLGPEVAARVLGREPVPEHVPQRRVGQVPAVGRAQEVLAHDGEVGVAVAQLGQLGDDVGEAPVAEDPCDLHVGVGLVVDPAEELQDEPLVVDDRGVRLLDRQRPGHLGRLVRRHPGQHLERQLGVDQGVVEHPPVGLAHRRALLALQEVEVAGCGAAAEHDLVDGGAAVGVGGLDEQPRQHGVALTDVQGRDPHVPGRVLAGEPPLPGQVRHQEGGQRLGQVVEVWHDTCLALPAARADGSPAPGG